MAALMATDSSDVADPNAGPALPTVKRVVLRKPMVIEAVDLKHLYRGLWEH